MLSEKASPFPLRLPSPAPQPPQSDERPSPAPQSPQSHEPLSDEEYEESSDSEATPVKKQKVNEKPLRKPTLRPGEMFLEDALRPVEKFLKDALRPGEKLLTHPVYFFPTFCDDDKIGDLDSWKRYWDQINESEGFDIKEYPGSGPMTTIFPMTYYLDHPENVQELEGYTSKALEEYNEKHGTKYKVKEILKVNAAGCQDVVFYLTLSVKNGKEEYFQVKVVRHMDQSLEFPIVRPRVKGGSDI